MKLPDRYIPTDKEFNGGGMATTVVCRDTHLDRDVLVKALQKDVDPKRITDEVAALSSIRSKHVVEIYDVIRDENEQVSAIVEELIPGEDINSKIPIKDSDTLLRYLYAISCGLADIHEIGRVHRDIKPNNMKFDGEGCLRIFDFGLSRTESDSSTTGTVGTIGYLAPELCVGQHDQADFTPAVDVFAFGATAIKMMRGKVPACLRAVPPTLPCLEADFTKQNVSLPKPVANLLNGCLSATPTKRPSMAEVRDILSSYIVRWKHKATLVVNDTIYTLDNKNTSVKLSGAGSSVTVTYDGVSFLITEVNGSASVSNIQIQVPHALPGSCVVILANPQGGTDRSFIPVDISYPEVVV